MNFWFSKLTKMKENIEPVIKYSSNNNIAHKTVSVEMNISDNQNRCMAKRIGLLLT